MNNFRIKNEILNVIIFVNMESRTYAHSTHSSLPEPLYIITNHRLHLQ